MHTNTTLNAPLIKILMVSCLFFSLHCAKSNVNRNDDSDTLFNSASGHFTQAHYAKSLRSTYLRLGYTQPTLASIRNIEQATSSDQARKLYEKEIDILIDHPNFLRKRMENYFKGQIDVWSDDPPRLDQRKPVNLGVYVFLNGLSINDFLLADYAVNDDLEIISGAYEGGPPVDDRAGYITTRLFNQKYATGDKKNKFHIVREVMGLNLNSLSPYFDIDVYRWDESMLNGKYQFDPSVSDINCVPCHSVNNVLRLAFRNYNGTNYIPGQNQGNYHFAMEGHSNDGSNREPIDENGDNIVTGDVQLYTKLTQDGDTFKTPRGFAQALVTHPNFPRAWTERFLTIMLDLHEGTTGTNKSVPNHFSATQEHIEFLDKWTKVFEGLDRSGKEFFRHFLKDPQYLMLVFKEEA